MQLATRHVETQSPLCVFCAIAPKWHALAARAVDAIAHIVKAPERRLRHRHRRRGRKTCHDDIVRCDVRACVRACARVCRVARARSTRARARDDLRTPAFRRSTTGGRVLVVIRRVSPMEKKRRVLRAPTRRTRTRTRASRACVESGGVRCAREGACRCVTMSIDDDVDRRRDRAHVPRWQIFSRRASACRGICFGVNVPWTLVGWTRGRGKVVLVTVPVPSWY